MTKSITVLSAFLVAISITGCATSPGEYSRADLNKAKRAALKSKQGDVIWEDTKRSVFAPRVTQPAMCISTTKDNKHVYQCSDQ